MEPYPQSKAYASFDGTTANTLNLLVYAGIAHNNASVALAEEDNWSLVATFVGNVSSIQPVINIDAEQQTPKISLDIFFIFYNYFFKI